MFRCVRLKAFRSKFAAPALALIDPEPKFLRLCHTFSARIAVGILLRRSLAAQSRLWAAVVFFRLDVWNIDPVRDCG
jgi:hypothetical protein